MLKTGQLKACTRVKYVGNEAWHRHRRKFVMMIVCAIVVMLSQSGLKKACGFEARDVCRKENENVFLEASYVIEGAENFIRTECITEDIEYRGKENTVITLISYFDGELDIEEYSELTDAILKSINASVVIEHRAEELFSVYAYTDDIASEKAVILGNMKINVNIAVNYDENKNQTRLYLANPILHIEY